MGDTVHLTVDLGGNVYGYVLVDASYLNRHSPLRAAITSGIRMGMRVSRPRKRLKLVTPKSLAIGGRALNRRSAS